MGGNCGHTGEKRSASRVLFHAEGVTGGIYLKYLEIHTTQISNTNKQKNTGKRFMQIVMLDSKTTKLSQILIP